MTNLSEHFTIEELTQTKTGLDNNPPLALAGNLARLAETLESVRELLGVPLKINSGYRSELVNGRVNGSRTSAHLYGRAADFVPVGMPISEAFDLIRNSGIVWDQLILEPSWLHIGIAPAREKSRQEVLTATMKLGGMKYAHV